MMKYQNFIHKISIIFIVHHFHLMNNCEDFTSYFKLVINLINSSYIIH